MVLIVEDNSDDAQLIIQALSRVHAQNLVWIKDGEQALDFVFHRGEYANAGRVSISLILLDLSLPKVDGIEVLTQIKRDVRSRLIPVVVLSASADETDIGCVYDLGANSYVTKPVSFDAFAQVMSSVGAYWLQNNRLPPG